MSKLVSYVRQHHLALLALFVALGGTSYAAATGSINSREIKNNTIRSKDIRNNTIRGRDIRRGAVRSSDVGNGSLLSEDFEAGQLPQGPQGPRGLTGAAGATSVVMRRSNAVTAQPDLNGTAVAQCNPGEVATGGSWAVTDGGLSDFFPLAEGPVGSNNEFVEGGRATGWKLTARNRDADNNNTDSIDIRALVVCASP